MSRPNIPTVSSSSFIIHVTITGDMMAILSPKKLIMSRTLNDLHSGFYTKISVQEANLA